MNCFVLQKWIKVMEKGGKTEDVAELLFHSVDFFLFFLKLIRTHIHTRFLGVYSFVSKFMSQWHVTRIFMRIWWFFGEMKKNLFLLNNSNNTFRVECKKCKQSTRLCNRYRCIFNENRTNLKLHD